MLTIFVVISGIGIYAWQKLAIDAYPDIADVTVGIATQVPGLAVIGDRATDNHSP